jgi:hypothetical protein
MLGMSDSVETWLSWTSLSSAELAELSWGAFTSREGRLFSAALGAVAFAALSALFAD